MNEEQVREALIEWESLSANKENRAVYEARLKELRDQLSNLQGERRLGREEGKIEGLEEGRLEGRQEGISIGIQQVAKKMLEQRVNPVKVAELTGLSLGEIRGLSLEKNDMKK